MSVSMEELHGSIPFKRSSQPFDSKRIHFNACCGIDCVSIAWWRIRMACYILWRRKNWIIPYEIFRYEISRNCTKMYSREEQPIRFGFLCKIFGVANNGVLIGVDGNTSPLIRDLRTRYQSDDLIISLIKPIWSLNFRSVPSFSFLFEVVKNFCIDQWIFLYKIRN